MPRLWNETIEAHREDVREAIIAATVAIVAERGLMSVTMSEVATGAGIGRATLYKYFPDVEAILRAWHQRQIEDHVEQLIRVRDSAEPRRRLEAVLEHYALSRGSGGHHDANLAAILHRDPSVIRSFRRVEGLIREIIVEAVRLGMVRADVPAAEAASYCIHAMESARHGGSRAAVRRLVAMTLAGLRPEAGPSS